MVRRNTVQRAMVLKSVEKLRNHPTADEVYADVVNDYPSISRATVYRNLGQLCESGKLKRRVIPNSPDRFDHNTTEHYHVHCNICGKVSDVDMDYLPNLKDSVKDSAGFIIKDYDLVFSGICPECAKLSENK